MREARPLLHSGFWRAYRSIRDDLKNAVRSALVAAGHRARLFTTGHSLGGALATIATVDLKPLVQETRSAFSMLPGGLALSPSQVARRLGNNTSSRSGRGAPGHDRRRSSTPELAPLDVSPVDSLSSMDAPSARRGCGGRFGVSSSRRDRTAASSSGLQRPLLANDTLHGPKYTGVVSSAHRDADVAAGWWSDDGRSDGRMSPADLGAGSTGDQHSVAVRVGAGSPTSQSAGAAAATGGGADVGAGARAGAGAGASAVAAGPSTDTVSSDRADEDLGSSADPGVGMLPARMDGGGGADNRKDLDVVSYTFGSPRVGNATFARLVGAEVPLTYRIVCDGDIIAGVPKFLWMYKHVGVEVVLDVAGNLIISPSAVESTLRNRSKRSFVAHSMLSYRGGLLNARDMQNLPRR